MNKSQRASKQISNEKTSTYGLLRYTEPDLQKYASPAATLNPPEHLDTPVNRPIVDHADALFI